MIKTLIALFLPATCLAQIPGEQLEQIFYAADVPGAQVAYFDTEAVVTYAYGVKKMGEGDPVDDETLFSAASLSKVVLAYVTMQLVDEGKIDLDTPLLDYYTYPDVTGEEHAKKVTARMVLTHRSGLPNWRKDRWSSDQMPPLGFKQEPDTKFSYSGEGFEWLQQTIETILGMDFETIARQRVFQPLGMDRTSFLLNPEIETNAATPHNKDNEPQNLSAQGRISAAYSLQTTALDYALFLQALLNQEGLSADVFEELLRKQTDVKGAVSWGLGIGRQDTDRGTQYWHWGDNGTFKGYFSFSVEKGEGFVYFCNSRKGLSMTPDLADALLDSNQPGWIWNGYDYYGKKADMRK